MFVDMSKHLKNGNCRPLSEVKETGKKICDTNEQESKNEAVVCKGCLKQFKRLQVHLRSKNGSKCKSLYNEIDINPEPYYQRNKEKIQLKNKSNYDRNKETIYQ